MRILTPASASIATQTAQKMIVLPKSGCFISRNAIASGEERRKRIDRKRFVAVLRLSSQAMATTKNGFRNSEGWTWPRPNSIHRRAPLCSGPTIGTNTSSTKKKAAPNSEMRRARSRGIIEMPIIAGIPTAIHASWRQK